jgi:hypothetical protein
MGDTIIWQKQQSFERRRASLFVPLCLASVLDLKDGRLPRDLLVVTTVFISEAQIKPRTNFIFKLPRRLSKRVKDLDIRER